MKIPTRIFILLALLLVSANSFALYSSLESLVEANSWVRRTQVSLQRLNGILADFLNAEAGQRGYIMTSDPAYLETYHQAYSSAGETLRGLKIRFRDNPDQLVGLSELEALFATKVAAFDEELDARINEGTRSARAVAAQKKGRETSGAIKAVIMGLSAAENALLDERFDQYSHARSFAFISMFVFIAGTLALISVVIFLAHRELASRKAAAEKDREYARNLSQSVEQLQSEREVILQINRTIGFLQSCNTSAEIGHLAGPFLQRLFPDYSGALRIYSPARDELQLLTNWGPAELIGFASPHDCWALRRGEVHHYFPNSDAPLCPHCQNDVTPTTTMCIPLAAHGETIGLLSLQQVIADEPGSAADNHDTQHLSEAVARHLSVTLANLRLKEELREQSVRDPLTSAFNRTYLDDIAEKTIAQARRHQRKIVVAMFDLDHFKQFNDTQGHLAGDVALTAVVDYVHANIREGDWLFRYGGEEFVLILQDIGRDEARTKLNELRHGISRLQLHLADRPLPSVTASIGASIFPYHGERFEELLVLADTALYEAKRQGRDGIVIPDLPAHTVLSA